MAILYALLMQHRTALPYLNTDRLYESGYILKADITFKSVINTYKIVKNRGIYL